MKIIDYSPINDRIFLTTINGEIEIYEDELHTIYTIYKGIENKIINSASFSHDAQHVIFVDQDGKQLNIISYDNLLQYNFNYIFNFKTDFIIEDYAVSPNKNRIAILFRLRHHIKHFIDRQRFMPDADPNNLLLHVYDFTPGNCRLIFRKYVNGIANIAFSQLDTIAIIGEFNVEGRDCALNIFDLNNGRLIDSGYEIDTVLFVTFYPESEDNHNKLLLITQDADDIANQTYTIVARPINNLHLIETITVESDINCIFIKRDGEIALGTNDGIKFIKIDGAAPLNRHLFSGKNIVQITYSQTENCIGFGVLDHDQIYKYVQVFNTSFNRITFNDEMDSSEDEEDEDNEDREDEYEDEESVYEEYEEDEDDEDEILINPADINKCIVPPTNPEKLQIYGNTNCFDTIQLNEENIGEYLSADSDNIVIFYKQIEDVDFLATCLSFTGLRKYLQDPKYGFYTCLDGKNIRTYIDDEPDFLKIPTHTQTIFVSYADIKQKYIQRQNMIFLEYNERVETTITYDASITMNFVSSNHCQDGSIIDVYRIIF